MTTIKKNCTVWWDARMEGYWIGVVHEHLNPELHDFRRKSWRYWLVNYVVQIRKSSQCFFKKRLP